MGLTREDRRVLEALDDRKSCREDQCESCDGRGSDSSATTSIVCEHCLGQGILLKKDEYELLIRVTGIGELLSDAVLNDDLLS
jgi:hypothetical protein